MTRNHQSWLTTWIWTVILFGLVVAGGAFEATDGPIFWLFDYLNGSTELQAFDDTSRFALAVLGAVTAAWGLSMKAGVDAALQLDRDAARPIWLWLTASVVVWFVIDCVLGVATGFWVTVIPNTSVLLTWLWPVWRSGVLRR